MVEIKGKYAILATFAVLSAVAFATPTLAIIDPTGLQAYYSFDQANFVDSTGNTSVQTQTALSNDTVAISGNSSYCANTYTQILDDVVWDVPSGVFTASIWIRTNDPNDYDTNIYGRETANAGYGAIGLYWTHDTQKMFGRTGTATTENSITTDGTVPTLAWEHIVFKRDGTKCYLYVNASSAATPITCVAPQDTNKIFRFCSLTAAYENYFMGNIDEFRLYNRNLTEAEITDLYVNASQTEEEPTTTTTTSVTTTTSTTTTTEVTTTMLYPMANNTEGCCPFNLEEMLTKSCDNATEIGTMVYNNRTYETRRTCTYGCDPISGCKPAPFFVDLYTFGFIIALILAFAFIMWVIRKI